MQFPDRVFDLPSQETTEFSIAVSASPGESADSVLDRALDLTRERNAEIIAVEAFGASPGQRARESCVRAAAAWNGPSHGLAKMPHEELNCPASSCGP